MAQVLTAQHVAQGIRAGFHQVFRSRTADVMDEVDDLFGIFPSDGASEIYAGYESAPVPRRWKKGDPIPSSAFRDFGYSVVNHRWAREIRWDHDDMQDDRTQQLIPRARDLGRRFAELPKRIGAQIFTSATDPQLLPSVPLAYDGLGLFNNTAGRFGLANGNVVAGSGVAAVSSLHADFYSAISGFRGMTDTESQPFWSETDIDGGAIVFCSPQNEQLFREAFELEIIQGAGAGIHNVAQGKARVKVWNRISGDDWYVVLTGTEFKPLLKQEREPVSDNIGDFTGSDIARTMNEFSMSFRERSGYGIWVPQTAIQIDN